MVAKTTLLCSVLKLHWPTAWGQWTIFSSSLHYDEIYEFIDVQMNQHTVWLLKMQSQQWKWSYSVGLLKMQCQHMIFKDTISYTVDSA